MCIGLMWRGLDRTRYLFMILMLIWFYSFLYSALDAIYVLGHRKESMYVAFAAVMGHLVRCHYIIGIWSIRSVMCHVAVVSTIKKTDKLILIPSDCIISVHLPCIHPIHYIHFPWISQLPIFHDIFLVIPEIYIIRRYKTYRNYKWLELTSVSWLPRYLLNTNAYCKRSLIEPDRINPMAFALSLPPNAPYTIISRRFLWIHSPPIHCVFVLSTLTTD